MNIVRLGVIGVGTIGRLHCRNSSAVNKCKLVAVCDTDKQRADSVAKEFGVKAYYAPTTLIGSHDVDAVIIATPHYSHTSIGIEALKQGLHVLVEKPISVHKADCLRLIAAHRNKKQVFAAMFNQRTDPHYLKVRQLIKAGELGRLIRINWIITNWFRPHIYYRSSKWRASWEGEGGGVLLNQCPHNLDLLWWICGHPQKITAFCSLGKWHNIEVEDEVTAFLEYSNGATAVFVTSTGEAPGTNRLEIAGEKGKIVVENNSISFFRNNVETSKFSRLTKDPFSMPVVEKISIEVNGHGGQHQEILQNFVDAIIHHTPLIAPAEEGVYSVEIANAMLYSSIKRKTVELPLNAVEYERLLKRLITKNKSKR